MLSEKLPVVKTLLLVLIAIVALSLAACAGEPGDTDVPDGDVDTQTTPQIDATEPADEPLATEPAATETITSTEEMTPTDEITPTDEMTPTDEITSTVEVTATEEMNGDATPTEETDSEDMSETPAATEESDGDTSQLTVEELILNSDAYVGQTVTVEGQINRMLASQVFLLGGDATTDGAVLVIAEDGFDISLTENSDVTATGTVVALDEASIEEMLNMDIQSDLLAEIDAQVAILAQSVEGTS